MPDVTESINAMDIDFYMEAIRGGNSTKKPCWIVEQIPLSKQMNPLYGSVTCKRRETYSPGSLETSNGKSPLILLLHRVMPLSVPPKDGQNDSNDSIELKCRRFLSAVRVLLPQEGGADTLSKALPGTIKNALSMFLPDPFSSGAFWYDEMNYYEMYFKALPVIAATFKELIHLLLKQGADPSEAAGVDFPRRYVVIQTAAEALISNFRRDDYSRGSNLREIDENVDKIIRDTILETLRMILMAGCSCVSPRTMYMLLERNPSLNLPFLHIYLDSVSLPEQRLYIDKLLELLEYCITYYYTTHGLMLRNNAQSLKGALTHHKSMLLSLRYLCRHSIVSVLWKSDTDTDRLPLPAALKHYIRHVAMYQ